MTSLGVNLFFVHVKEESLEGGGLVGIPFAEKIGVERRGIKSFR